MFFNMVDLLLLKGVALKTLICAMKAALKPNPKPSHCEKFKTKWETAEST